MDMLSMIEPCMRLECTGEASLSIKAVVPLCGCEFYEGPPIEFYSGLRLCPACANRMKAPDLFNKGIKAAIRGMLRNTGSARPDFERAKLILISINDLDLLQLEASNATIH
jgi:hypothetical protein